MVIQPREDYIEKLVLLEKRVGAKTSYEIFEPVAFVASDIVQIQNIATMIANFIGLNGLTFVISRVKQKDTVGGNIELTEKSEGVFVEISDDIAQSQDSILAVLAHEITHKYLSVNNITVGVGPFYTYENEILTDITSVFLGLGKLMLNGCDITSQEQHQVASGTQTITHRVKCGYLDQEQLAFVYRLVCAMRGISEKEMLSNLSTTALTCISMHNIQQDDFFNTQFNNREYGTKQLNTIFDDIRRKQNRLEEIREYLEVLKEKYIGEIEKSIQTKNKEFNTFKESIKATNKETIYDPCLRFLENIALKKKIDSIQKEVKQSSTDIQKLESLLDDIPKPIVKNESAGKSDQAGTNYKHIKKSLFKKILR